MQALHSISLSALLLAASLPTFAGTVEEAAQATPAPLAPALEVVPSAAPTAPLTSAVPVYEAGVANQVVPAAPAMPATQAVPATAQTPITPAVPAGTAALGGLVDPQTLALINQLRALQVTPQQAVGGVGALLGLAQSQMTGDDYARLAGAVPGLQFLGGNNGSAASASSGVGGVIGRLGALSGLLGGSASQAAQPQGNVDSLAGVGQAFSVLGMDTSLVGQFAPILLQFLVGQGVAGVLLDSLSGIWGVPGVLTPAPVLTPTPAPVVSAPAAADGGY